MTEFTLKDLTSNEARMRLFSAIHGGGEVGAGALVSIAEAVYHSKGDEAMEDWVVKTFHTMPPDTQLALVCNLLGEFFGPSRYVSSTGTPTVEK